MLGNTLAFPFLPLVSWVKCSHFVVVLFALSGSVVVMLSLSFTYLITLCSVISSVKDYFKIIRVAQRYQQCTRTVEKKHTQTHLTDTKIYKCIEEIS